ETRGAFQCNATVTNGGASASDTNSVPETSPTDRVGPGRGRGNADIVVPERAVRSIKKDDRIRADQSRVGCHCTVLINRLEQQCLIRHKDSLRGLHQKNDPSFASTISSQ